MLRQCAKFSVVGLAGVVIVLAGADFLHYVVGFGQYDSVTIATLAGMIPNFAANRYWTFRHHKARMTWRQAVLFFALNCAGMLFQYVCVGLVVAMPGMNGRLWYTAANFLGLVLGAAFRFWSYRKWVWRSSPSTGPRGPRARRSSRSHLATSRLAVPPARQATAETGN